VSQQAKIILLLISKGFQLPTPLKLVTKPIRVINVIKFPATLMLIT